MKKFFVCVLVLCLALCFACGKSGKSETPSSDVGTDTSDTPSSDTPDTPAKSGDILGGEDVLEPEKDNSIKYGDYAFQGEFKDESIGDIVLVSASITLPKAENNEDIAYYYSNIIDKFKELAHTYYLPLAKGNYEFSQNGLGIFTPITIDIGYEVKLNDGKLFSVRREAYEYTGGAHPISTLSSETFRVSDGAKMLFCDLFSVSREDVNTRLRPIIEQMMTQREQEGISYYPNAKAEALTLRSEEDYYLTDTALVLYWQPYDLAPYAAGLQEFAIPLSDLADILKTEF